MEFEPLDQFHQRQKKLAEIVAQGRDPYPHKYDATHTAERILEKYDAPGAPAAKEQLEAEPVKVRVAGRIVALRPHGKAGFAHILGQGKRLQLYVKLDAVGPAMFDKTMDDFGMAQGGRQVTSRQFQEAFERATGRNLEAFFDTWLRQKGLPEGG